jgi:hypothetical protein
MRTLLASSVTVAILAFPLAQAETEEFTETCDTRICSWRRPIVDPPPGWSRDNGASRHYKMNAFAPNGSSFADAPAVMYALAVDKSSFPEKSLPAFLGRGHPSASGSGGIEVAPTPRLTTGDGKSFEALRYAPPPGSEGQHETVAYGEEGDYFVVFVISARTAKAHDAAYASFVELLRGYTKVPKRR